MSTLLRKAKSTLNAGAHAGADEAGETARPSAAVQNNYVNNTLIPDNGQPPPVPPKDTPPSPSFFHHFSSIRDRRKSRTDLSAAVESESSTQARHNHLQKQNSILKLRRRLVRKASTFNLHSHRLGASTITSPGASHRRSEHLFPDTDSDSAVTPTFTRDIPTRRLVPSPDRSATASTACSEAAEIIVNCRQSSNTARSDSDHSRVTAVPTDPSKREKESESLIGVQGKLLSDYPSYKASGDEQGRSWSKMAATAPPLPYEILKKITVEACDTALSSVKAYDHPKTESWNTTIINTILAQLVGETSGSSDSSAASAAPKYKFVVNSTIVQHRNSMSENQGGRRGMHSAAGAYWNNEKDGMWSFKYDAGDTKGLDVVVGIVWVWVG